MNPSLTQLLTTHPFRVLEVFPLNGDMLMAADTSESDLPWTGERYVPQIGGEIELEHVHRYLWAAI